MMILEKYLMKNWARPRYLRTGDVFDCSHLKTFFQRVAMNQFFKKLARGEIRITWLKGFSLLKSWLEVQGREIAQKLDNCRLLIPE
jgi:hypothetical protein